MYSGSIRWLSSMWRIISNHSRRIALKSKYPGVAIGNGTMIGRGVECRCTDGGHLQIGSGVTISDYCVIIVRNGSVTIGDDTYLGRGAFVVATESVGIGKGCLIAEYVTIRDSDHDVNRYGRNRNAASISAAVSIADGVWLGAKSTVTRGSSIGCHAVVGANAVVTKDVPAYCVAVGAPARVVRRLDPEPAASVFSRDDGCDI